jgi:glycerol-3-phosphate acyltransferase PlsX
VQPKNNLPEAVLFLGIQTLPPKSRMNRPLRIALDAMGGDFAPQNEVQGAILAAQQLHRQNIPVEIVFVGKEKEIHSALAQQDTDRLVYSIVHADEIVTMDDDPTAVLKKKRNSSLFKGVELHSNGYVDAFVSAGNTGAVLSTATIVLGRVKGVSRPTIGSFLPTQLGNPVLLLDVGANIEGRPRFLYEFAVMGSIYSRQVLGVENPRIGLLNIGEEKTKGTENILQTYALLEESSLNFIGNVEGRDVLIGSADVVVCDGFVGNIVLKFAESMLGLLKAKIKDHARKGLLQKLGVMLMVPTLKSVLKDFDYQEYGGVPLLGVNGVVIIGHGKSSPKALKNMIVRSVEVVQKDINKKIENALRTPDAGTKQTAITPE